VEEENEEREINLVLVVHCWI